MTILYAFLLIVFVLVYAWILLASMAVEWIGEKVVQLINRLYKKAKES